MMPRIGPLLAAIQAALRRHPVPGCAGWSAAAIVAIWSAALLHLYVQSENALAAVRSSTVDMARAYAESLVHEFRDIDQTLLCVRTLHARYGDALDLEPWVNAVEWTSRRVWPIAMTDRDGLLRFNDRHRVTERIDLSDSPPFRHFADGARANVDDHLFIGSPVRWPDLGGWSLAFARPLMTPLGRFDGVVMVPVDPGVLAHLDGAAEVGRGTVVTLVGLDGIVRAVAGGTQVASEPLGQRSSSPAIERAGVEAEGSFESIDPIDGTGRMNSFRRLDGYPLLVQVSVAADQLPATFRDDRVAVLLVGLALTVAVVIAGIDAHRRATRRSATRQAANVALENIDQGVIVVDPQGRIAVLNRRAAELLDIPARFAPGVRFTALVDWQRAEGEFRFGKPLVLSPQHRTTHPDLTAPNDYRRTRPNGTMLEVRTRALPDGSAIRTYRDVTQEQQTPAKEVSLSPPAPAAEDDTVESHKKHAADAALDHLMHSLGTEAVAGIVATFVDGLPCQLGRMRDLAAVGDTETLMREAQALAGSAATIGLDELAAAAGELEQDARRRLVAAIAARLDRIDLLARPGTDRLAAYLHKRAA